MIGMDGYHGYKASVPHVHSHFGSKACFRPRSFMEQFAKCISDHEGKCDVILGRKQERQTLLLDVEQMKIVEATTSEKYFCLGYVWGGTPTYQLTSNMVDELKESHSLCRYEHCLSRAASQAITIARSMKQRYLWVETLCIIQDDASHKHGQILNTDIIYGHAAMTIILASAPSTNHSTLRHDEGEAHYMNDLDPEDYQELLGRIERKMGVQVQYSEDFGSRPTSVVVYPIRAWIFQEMLSRRLLYITSWGSFYACRNTRVPGDLNQQRS
jgi:Heterokaryon incompatibility protein (HET)